MSWSIDYSDWRIFKRFEDLNAAYEIGLREAPAAIYAETSYHVEEFLKGILPALLQMCIIQAASTALGAGIGAGLGAFVFGAGAIPGAAIGAELGFDLGLAILGWLGLAFLAVAIGHSLVDLVVLIKAAVVQAWGAADKGEARGQNVRQAGQTLARAIAILVRLILTGIVAWLTKKGIDKAPELIAQIKASKLGVGFAEWVEKNLTKLTNDPKLRGHKQGEGSTTKVADAPAQSPSQLAKKPVEDVPPPPPPPPPKKTRTQVRDLARQRQQAMLDTDKGYNVSPTSWDKYPTIGRNGSFISDKQCVTDVIGDIPSNGGTMTITKAQATALEDAMGLENGSLADGFKVREVTGINEMSPRSPMEGNDLFLGPGEHLPGGAPEMVVDSIPTTDAPGVTTLTTILVH